jgi:hypothetical protein
VPLLVCLTSLATGLWIAHTCSHSSTLWQPTVEGVFIKCLNFGKRKE